MSDADGVKRDTAGRLMGGVTCISCGYVLRGLNPAGKCPECGYAVASSLSPDRLELADRAWLGRLRGGADRVLLGLGFGTVMFVVLIASLMAYPAGTLVFENLRVWALAVLPGLVVFGGCRWMLGAEPGRVAEPGDLAEAARRVALAACWAVLVLALLTGPVRVVEAMWRVDDTAFPAAAFTLIGVGGLAVVVAGFGAMIYGRRLAQRVPADRLVKWTWETTKAYAFLCAIACVIALVVGLAGISSRFGFWLEAGGAFLAMIGAVCLVVLVLAVPVMGMMTLGLLVGYRMAFAAAAGRAGEMMKAER